MQFTRDGHNSRAHNTCTLRAAAAGGRIGSCARARAAGGGVTWQVGGQRGLRCRSFFTSNIINGRVERTGPWLLLGAGNWLLCAQGSSREQQGSIKHAWVRGLRGRGGRGC